MVVNLIEDDGNFEELENKEIFYTTVDRDTLNSGELRINASSYSSEIVEAKKLVTETDYEVKPLSELCEDIFKGPRFKRVWVEDEEHGYPYVAPKDLALYKPRLRQRENPQKAFLSKQEYSDDFDHLSVNEGWLLVTRSGSIGRIFLVTESFEKYLVTDDVIRIVPKDDTLEGYLYSYLDSWVGQALLTQNEHGVTVDHINPPQIEDLPVILPPEERRKQLHNKAKKAYGYREKFLHKDREAVKEANSIFERD